MDKDYIIQLLQSYFTNQASHAEREALFAEVEKYKNNQEWEELLTSILPQLEEEKTYNPEHYQSIINTILKPKARVIPLYRRKAFKYMAAAAVMIIIATTAIVISKRSEKSPATEVATTHDVPAPANTRAVITLADGSKVYLDSASNGTIAQENNVSVVKNEKGEIIYSHKGTKAQSEIVYNTMFNPRGSKVISLTLSDGTKVWLNSESSLKYPIAFNASTREVEITGEAYFEVKHNSKQPFKVHLPNGSVVEDIGTAFNVNAYVDEEAIKTTLIEGSVKVAEARGPASRDPRETPGVDNSVILKPGQQAILNQVNPKITRIEVQNDVETDEVLAWKNGMFLLDNTDLPTIMRQISRWYDVDVVYEGKIPGARFVGGVSKNLPLSKVLELLKSNGIETRLEGKKIIVK